MNMLKTSVLALLAGGAVAQYGGGMGPDEDGKYKLEAEGIRAYFIPYGASVTNLFIKDVNGIERDIVLGYDNATYYTEDENHPHYGGVPGRYANRIKNSTFEIDGTDYHILPNEHDGANTLHGGPNGWDYRNFTVVSYTPDSITFALTDPDGEQGFPGVVESWITYTVTPYAWYMKMVAIATTKKTPIMLTNHAYWNLDGFQNNATDRIDDHLLYLPYSGQRVGVDNILIPDGTILANTKGGVNDFWSAPKALGSSLSDPAIIDNCGLGCKGYDNCFLVDRAPLGPFDWRERGPVAVLSSPYSGIQVDIYTDQDAFQVYSCAAAGAAQIPLKKTQGFFDDASKPRVVTNYSCVVMEVQDYIAGINNPEWGRLPKQIFGPGSSPYVLEAEYRFSANKTLAGTE